MNRAINPRGWISVYRTKIAYDPLARLRMAVVAARENNTGLMKGIMAAIAASLAFTLMDVFVKALPNIASSELTFFRGVVGLVFIPLLCRQTHERFFTGEYWRLLALRGFFGSCGLFFFFLSIRGLTLGDSQILAQLSAFFMCLLSPFFLEERLPRQAIPGLLLITAGTLAVVQIWNFSSFNIYALYGIAGGFCSAAAYIVISRLAENGMKQGTEIVFYFQIFSILIGAALMENFVWPQGIEWLWIVGMGLCALAAQMLMTWAFQHINSILVSFLMYTEILFHVWFGWFIWDEVLTTASCFGGLCIIAGSLQLMVCQPKNKEHVSTHQLRNTEPADDDTETKLVPLPRSAESKA